MGRNAISRAEVGAAVSDPRLGHKQHGPQPLRQRGRRSGRVEPEFGETVVGQPCLDACQVVRLHAQLAQAMIAVCAGLVEQACQQRPTQSCQHLVDC